MNMKMDYQKDYMNKYFSYFLLLILPFNIGWTKEFTVKWLKERTVQTDALTRYVEAMPEGYTFVIYFSEGHDLQVVPISPETLTISQYNKTKVDAEIILEGKGHWE